MKYRLLLFIISTTRNHYTLQKVKSRYNLNFLRMEDKNAKLHAWRMPQPFENTMDIMERMFPLKVMNSLTRTKVRFIPKNPSRVLWYQCGPTVYAESHMGHAKTYMHLDIIRRIAQDCFGYNIIVCQNVTDIDDKIIIRSSERKMPFLELAAMYEADFMEDMAKLGVQAPDLVTRVSEYVPEIVAYIETLISKGVAYASNGSVYFNTSAFECCGHKYGKLLPEQIGNSDLLAEGEGALTENDDKKNATDFVLWKKTKQHADDNIVEPSWPSPWGQGRPGWHIECSVMSNCATELLGGGLLDVHAGGVDLKFPHHENEIAQSEGYLGCKQWTNYWLHTGHLNIKGFKMSKSLKNFITIKQALEMHTARQMRFCFLMHKYNVPMDYGDGTMAQAVSVEKIFNDFFLNVKAILRRLGSAGPQHVGLKEQQLVQYLEDVKQRVYAALCDDFDTPVAINALQELIRAVNRYVEEPVVSSVVLNSVARYVTGTLKTFGLIQDGSEIGFPLDAVGNASGGGVDPEAILAPYLDALAKFREVVRLAAMKGNSSEILLAADELRDVVLPDLGVRLEEKGSGGETISIWKLDNPETMRLERQQKADAKALKEAQKVEQQRKLREKEEKAKIPPEEFFKTEEYAGQYSAYSDNGVPSHDAKGELLSKNMVKKLEKDLEKQRVVYNKYMESKA